MIIWDGAAPTLEQRAGLDIVEEMPTLATQIFVTVAKASKRVSVGIELTDAGGHVLFSGHLRVGLHIWRTVMLPALQFWATSANLKFHIREVLPNTGPLFRSSTPTV